MAEGPVIRAAPTEDLSAAELADLRALAWSAFAGVDPMTEADWDHALGGVHVFLELDGAPISHAALVERPIRVGERELRTGYVEAEATAQEHQGLGFGTRGHEAPQRLPAASSRSIFMPLRRGFPTERRRSDCGARFGRGIIAPEPWLSAPPAETYTSASPRRVRPAGLTEEQA